MLDSAASSFADFFVNRFKVFLPVFLEAKIHENKLEIGGFYGVDIPLYAIQEARLCKSLPKINIRTNGFVLGDTNMGHFRTAKGMDVMLFIYSDQCILAHLDRIGSDAKHILPSVYGFPSILAT